MSELILEEVRDFLKNASLSNYEIDSYIALLTSGSLTARDLSEKSGVPVGRIYNVLEELSDRHMIEIQDSRPKKYRALSFNLGFQNLIRYTESQEKKRLTSLVDQAKLLENRVYNSEFLVKREETQLFWSTAFGWRSMLSLYEQKCSELQEELLITGFVNDRTVRVLRYARDLFNSFKSAYNRGVRIRYLWSFQFDDRPLTDEQIEHNFEIRKVMKQKFNELFGVSDEMKGFQMRYLHKRIPTIYDIFDKERVIIKLLNPLRPYQIFGCINVFDIKLATELRRQYLEMWNLESFE